MVEPVRHRQTKGAETDMFEPKATASHLDSTRTWRRPLLRVRRTCRAGRNTSDFDPNATSTRRGPSHPAYDGYFDLAPPPIPAGSGCVISSRIGMGISVAALV